jgi:hypothetical protein
VITVTFHPDTEAAGDAVLAVTDDASDSPQQTTLLGYGYIPTVAAGLQPTLVTFPLTSIGTRSGPV